MVGERYWSTGITLVCNGGKWSASADFQDDGFCQERSTEGKIWTRYQCESLTLAEVLDLLREDAERLGIAFRTLPGNVGPSLYYQGDGEDQDFPPPEGWERLLADQAERIGWNFFHAASQRSPR